MKRVPLKWAALAATLIVISGCKSMQPKPMETVAHVDLPRFMGDWYVIANIPTFIEKGTRNSVESYRLDPDGTVGITFTYNDDAPDGPRKTITSRGFIVDRRTNATWGVQFIWPFKADYRVVHVSEDYGQTVIAREKRDYVWIMARTPHISDADYQRLVAVVAKQGYDVNLIQKVPQRWN